MVNYFLPNNGISFLFWDPKEIVVFNILFSHDPNPNAIIIHEDFPPSLVILALLTSSFLLIHSPPSYLGLQTSSQATKGKPLNH